MDQKQLQAVTPRMADQKTLVLSMVATVHAADGEDPVAFLAQVIFSLDYQGVEEADYEEGAEADGDAQQPVRVQEFSHL